MLFSKKKKTQRDRDAGLVFRWRGGHATNLGGGTLALCITSAVFAGGFLLLSVSAKPNTVPSRYRASIIQLFKIDDRLAWRIEKNSPSMPKWSASDDELSIFKVDELLASAMNARQHSSLGYQELEIEPKDSIGDKIFTLNSDTLPAIERLVSEDIEVVKNVAAGSVQWNLEISANGALKDRLPKDIFYDGWVPESWRGRSVRFSVAVDSRGRVLVVNPVDWLQDETVEKFENWLYATEFAPLKSSNSTDIGVVEFRSVSEVVPVDRGGEKQGVEEEQP